MLWSDEGVRGRRALALLFSVVVLATPLPLRAAPAPQSVQLLAQSGDAWIGFLPEPPTLLLANAHVEQRLPLDSLPGQGLASLEVEAPTLPGAPHPAGGGAPPLGVLYEDASGARHSGDSLRYAGLDTEREPGGALRATLRFFDPDTNLGVWRSYRLWPDAGAIERVTTLENAGRSPLRILRADSLATGVSAAGAGSWDALTATADSGSARQTLSPGRAVRIDSRAGGGLMETAIPSFVLHSPAAGGGVFGGLLWSANYEIRLAAGAEGTVSITGGEQLAGWLLSPGQRFEAPAAFAVAFRGDADAGSRALHRYLEASRSRAPVPEGAAAGPGLTLPVTWNSWFAYGRDLDERRLLAEARLAADAGVEVFYVDHGWQRLTGDWRARPDRFTDGSLATLSDQVHRLGMRFGAWIAFGVVDPHAPVALQHPEWLAAPPSPGAPYPVDGARLLCLAAAKDWVIGELDRAVREYQLDWLKFDQAMIGSCAGEGAPPDAVAASLRENTLAFYDVLRTVRRLHPTLVLENCFDGGGYLDNALYGLTDVAWLTDAAGHPAAAPLELQQALAGATRAMPAQYLMLWLAHQPPAGAADPGAAATAARQLDYQALSSMGGAWGLSIRLADLDLAQRAQVASLVERYKRLRPLIAGGALHHVTDPTADSPLVLAYVAPDASRAAALAVRNGDATALPADLRLTLPDVAPDALYALEWDGPAGRTSLPPLPGSTLAGPGLTLPVGGQQGGILYATRIA
ncbi:MAG TPA: glycoside hydrolase family 36 protein [Chloroflexota bacterium]|nr:glycoside hydrolase family 36 protein [Chloroflexota bacterium]